MKSIDGISDKVCTYSASIFDHHHASLSISMARWLQLERGRKVLFLYKYTINTNNRIYSEDIIPAQVQHKYQCLRWCWNSHLGTEWSSPFFLKFHLKDNLELWSKCWNRDKKKMTIELIVFKRGLSGIWVKFFSFSDFCFFGEKKIIEELYSVLK